VVLKLCFAEPWDLHSLEPVISNSRTLRCSASHSGCPRFESRHGDKLCWQVFVLLCGISSM